MAIVAGVSPSAGAEESSAPCAGPNAKLAQGDLDAARDGYIEVLAANPNATCATSGLADVHASQNHEKKLCAEAAALDEADKAEEADARYSAALRENVGSACAKKGLKPPDDGRNFDSWVELLPKIAAAVGAVLLLILLVPLLIGLIWTWATRRRPSLVVKPFGHDAVEPKVGGGVASMVEERLIELRRSGERARGADLDLDLVMADVEMFADDESLADAVGGVSDVSQLQVVVAALALFDRLTHKRRFTVGGELLPKGPDGIGIALALDRRNAALARTGLWESNVDDWVVRPAPVAQPAALAEAADGSEPPPDPAPYYLMAGAAAAWTQYEVGRALDESIEILTSSGESFALVSAGLQLHRADDLAGACELYARALQRDPDNVAATANLGFALRDLQLFLPALVMLVNARQTLERKHEALR